MKSAYDMYQEERTARLRLLAALEAEVALADELAEALRNWADPEPTAVALALAAHEEARRG